MMRKILFIVVVVFVLAALLPGCARGVADAQEEFPGSKALDELDGYRYRITMTVEGGDMSGAVGITDIQLEGEFIRQPESIHLVISIPEGAEGVEDMPCGKARCEYIWVEDDTWFYDEETDSWEADLAGSAYISDLLPSRLLETFLKDWPEEAELVDAHDDLEGVDTSHYRWEPSPEEARGIFSGEVLEVADRIEELAFDLWLSNELGYPARCQFVLAGQDEEGKSVGVEFSIAIFDVNEPITIEAPPQPEEPTPTPTSVTEEEGADPYLETRKKMVETQIRARDITDEEVLTAMETVPRHEFVPQELIDQAYRDHPLPIGYGQTISQPYIVALMTQLLHLTRGDKVLEIGTGSGYQAAVLAELTDQVYTVEIVAELEAQAEERLKRLGYSNVKVKHADGYYGWEEYAPYEAIIVTAAPDHIPQPLLQQLKDGGRLVIPVGPPGGYQTLWQIEKKGEEIISNNITGVIFVPLTGEH